MKVLQIITKSNWGGAQKHVFEISLALRDQGITSEVACGIILGKAPLSDRLKRAGIAVYPITSLGRDISIYKDLLSFFEIIKIIKKTRPDIVHLHSSKIGGLGSLAARVCGVKKIIFTAHGTPFKEDRFFIVNCILRFLSYLTVVLSDKTICVSQGVYGAYPKLFVSKKLDIVANGMSEPMYLDRKEARQKLHITIPSHILCIGVIAELHTNKGLEYLLASAKKLLKNTTSFQIHILGDGELKEKLKKYIEDTGLSEHVYIHGFVAEAATYLKAFDIFVLPSINEGLPYVLLEAGLAQLPIVASAVGGIPEVIIDRDTGLLVPSRDPKALEKALTLLLHDQNLRDLLSKNITKKIHEEYSLETMISKIIQIYVSK